IMIYKSTKYPEQTKVFLKWWSENGKTMWTNGQAAGFHARKSILQDAYWQNDALRKQITNQYLPIIKTTGSALTGGLPELNEIEGDGSASRAIQMIIAKKPVEDVLKEMDASFKKIMKE